VPVARDAFQRVPAPVGELDIRARDEIAHRVRDEYLARACQRGNPSTGVHGDTSPVVAPYLALTGVQPVSDLDPEPACVLGDRMRAVDRPRGPVERGRTRHRWF
jgi:hypothetical protein